MLKDKNPLKLVVMASVALSLLLVTALAIQRVTVDNNSAVASVGEQLHFLQQTLLRLSRDVNALAEKEAEMVPPGHIRTTYGQLAREGRILIKSKAGVSEEKLELILSRHESRQVGVISAINVREIAVPPQAEEALVKAFSNRPEIEFVELDYLEELVATIPNDPRYNNAWHLPKINAPYAWSTAKGEGIVVAVLDTGIDAAHPDFEGQLVAGWNSVSQNDDISDINGHGTRVAGAVGAATNNSTGVASVGWNAKIMPVRITNNTDGWAYWSDVARGLTWAADNGAHVANISYQSWRSSTVSSAAKHLRDRGGLTFAAAGNDGSDVGSVANPDIIIVAATNSSDAATSWSNHGVYVDLAAPGESIYTTNTGTGYWLGTGTSFATPVAAGVAALVMAANPQLLPAQVEQILFDSAKDLGAEGWDPYYGWGRVDAQAAVLLALETEVVKEPEPDLDATSPVTTIVSPQDGATLTSDIIVKVDATDDVGVVKVELLINGSVYATDGSSPYEFYWDTNTVENGQYRLVSRAYDEAGNTGTSAEVTVTVDNVLDIIPPEVSITSPNDGAQVPQRGQVDIVAEASDNIGVVRVDIFINGRLQDSCHNVDKCAIKVNAKIFSDGNNTITARAYDTAGNMDESSITVHSGSSSDGSGDDGGGGGGDDECSPGHMRQGRC